MSLKLENGLLHFVTFYAWKMKFLNSMAFQAFYEPYEPYKNKRRKNLFISLLSECQFI